MVTEQDTAPSIANQFYVYICKECHTAVIDPVNHSIGSEHYMGFTVKTVPLEVEQTKEQIESTGKDAAVKVRKANQPAAHA